MGGLLGSMTSKFVVCIQLDLDYPDHPFTENASDHLYDTSARFYKLTAKKFVTYKTFYCRTVQNHKTIRNYRIVRRSYE